jgi:hypothetical protein
VEVGRKFAFSTPFSAWHATPNGSGLKDLVLHEAFKKLIGLAEELKS